MIGLMCPKEVMLTKPMVRVSVLFTITGIFLTQILYLKSMYKGIRYYIFPKVCNSCHDLT